MDGVDLYAQFIALHRPQLQVSGVPEKFWRCLFQKVSNEIFDAGNAFSLLLIDYGDEPREECDPVWTVCVTKEDGISADDPEAVYLIDHAWTFRVDQARSQLNAMPQLVDRMAGIMGINSEDDNCVEKIMKSIWKYCQSYSIQANGVAVEDQISIWYIMDELGSGINHSDDPNFRIVPFLYIPSQITYSILFPIESTEAGDVISRDYLENIPKDTLYRDALLLPWKHSDLSGEDFTQIEPSEDYFLEGHASENYTDGPTEYPVIDTNRPLRVYSEYEVLTNSLTDPAFEIVDDPESADILWLATHFKTFDEFAQSTPNKFINQFPYEFVLTIKDLLSIVCRRGVKDSSSEDLSTLPRWLPTTYNLRTELVKFVSYYQNRQKEKLDNHWIIKPFNLARGLDTYITSDLIQITRLSQTGPKIAQKYVEDPVLFERQELGGKVKFDVRYVILLKDVENLEAYVYSNFFLRFANKSFALTNFDDYEQHFTVMNYREEAELRHIKCSEFLDMWVQQYPDHSWNEVEDNICSMLNETFVCATSKKPPCAIGACKQSRALYAADIMLAWENGRIQPKLLEINWMPDCKRACDYYPDFYNDIFKLLFLNEANDGVFRKISE